MEVVIWTSIFVKRRRKFRYELAHVVIGIILSPLISDAPGATYVPVVVTSQVSTTGENVDVSLP
jgi:hypothetical protein